MAHFSANLYPNTVGTPTLNQWVLVEEDKEMPVVITIECCGLLVGSTAEEIAAHVKASWATGKPNTNPNPYPKPDPNPNPYPERDPNLNPKLNLSYT